MFDKCTVVILLPSCRIKILAIHKVRGAGEIE